MFRFLPASKISEVKSLWNGVSVCVTRAFCGAVRDIEGEFHAHIFDMEIAAAGVMQRGSGRRESVHAPVPLRLRGNSGQREQGEKQRDIAAGVGIIFAIQAVLLR